jgi:hypothetical protein
MVLHKAGDDPLTFPLWPVQILIPSHHWQQRKIIAKQQLSGWAVATTPENAEDWLGTHLGLGRWRAVGPLSAARRGAIGDSAHEDV